MFWQGNAGVPVEPAKLNSLLFPVDAQLFFRYVGKERSISQRQSLQRCARLVKKSKS